MQYEITCSKCLQLEKICIRGCHYDFVVTNSWKASFKNSSVPLKLQYWGVRQNLCPAFTACCASCLHTKHEQLPHTMSRMWEPNQGLGTSSPCRAISKTCLGRKRSPICSFPTSMRFEIQAACVMQYTYTEVHFMGTWHRLEATQEEKNACMFYISGRAGRQQ